MVCGFHGLRSESTGFPQGDGTLLEVARASRPVLRVLLAGGCGSRNGVCIIVYSVMPLEEAPVTSPQRGPYVAECIDLDLLVEADDPESAKRQLRDAICGYL